MNQRSMYVCFRLVVATFLLIQLLSPIVTVAQDALKGKRVLLYTKNGKGYVHDNIPTAVAAIRELASENGFLVDVADTSLVFTEDNLRKYALLIFASTNNDVFATDEQRLAFRRYIEAGGGFVGIHSVTGTERNWTWFKMMIGTTFAWHPRFQQYTVRKIDPAHPSVTGMPDEWSREDECYFGKEYYPGIRVLMAHDLRSLDTTDSTQASLIDRYKGSFSYFYPAVWWQPFQGGNVWITTLGHDKSSYNDAVFRRHLLGGIRFIAGEFKGIDFSKAKAKTKDDTINP